MHTPSWLKRFKHNKKGMSSIVGAVFMIMIIGILASGYFVFTLGQNSVYTDAVRSDNDITLMQMSESIKVPSPPTYTPSGSGVQVSVTLENDGPIGVQVKTLWIETDVNNYGFATIDQYLSPGESWTPPPITVNPQSGAINSENCFGWVVTARGRTFELYPDHGIGPQGPQGETGPVGSTGPQGPQGPQGTTSYDANTALVSQGIGSIAMNFTQFRIYDFGTLAQPNGTLLSSGTEYNSYTIHNANYYAIRIPLVNMDARTTNISISCNSYIWAINPQKGTLKGAAWNILYLGADGKLYTGDNFYVNLPYNTTVNVYFGIANANFAASAIPTVVPLNILLFGNFVYKDSTTSQYGQNLPFVALNIPN